MSVSPTQTFPPPAEPQAVPGKVRPEDQTFPPSADLSLEPTGPTNSAPPVEDAAAQDEVKLQWNTTEQIPVYQFVNQQGSLILQVPSQQVLNLAIDISQELAQEDVVKPEAAVSDGGKNYGN